MQPKVNITATPPDLIPKIWDVVWPLLREAVDASLFLTAEALKAELMEDKSILFVATVNGAISGAVVVKIEDVKSKIRHIIALGGKGITDWKVPMVDAMEKTARGMGCKYIVSAGTQAWKKILPDFASDKILFYKEVA